MLAATLATVGVVVPTVPATAADSCSTLFAEMFNAAGDGTTVVLTCNATITAADDLPLAVAPGATVTLDLFGQTLEVTGPAKHAGIGVPEGATLIVDDSSSSSTGVLVATGQSNTASGIGGADGGSGGSGTGNAGTLIIEAGDVTASGGYFSAGVGGGGTRSAGGTVVVNGGSLTASGDFGGGAGIGGGNGGPGGTVTINGGTVTADGNSGAGIGGGSGTAFDGGDAGTVTVNGGTVVATSTSGGAGIGSGRRYSSAIEASGGSLEIGPAGHVTVSGGEGMAIGGPEDIGSVSNAGTLVLAGGDSLDLKGDTLTNNGTISTAGTISGTGTLAGDGTIDNAGAIAHTVDVADTQQVTDRHYALGFDGNGGAVDWAGTAPWSVVLGPTLGSVERSTDDLPPATRTGHTFDGWFLATDATGDAVSDTTEFSGSSNDGTPVPITLYAGWTADAPATVDRYVTTDGDNSANDCLDAGNPCRTIDYAVRQVFAATPFNPDETIHVAAGTYPEAVYVEPSSTTHLTIVGAGPESTVIAGAASSPDQTLWLQRAASITLQDLAVSGNATGDGIAVFNSLDGPLTLTNVRVSGHDADGIDISSRNTPLTVTIEQSSIDGNGDRGLEVGEGPTTVTVIETDFSDNAAGIEMNGEDTIAAVNVVNSTFTGNASSGAEASGGTLTIADSTFTGNGAGVGVHDNGNLTVTDSTITGSTDAGVLARENGTITLTRTSLSDNPAAAVLAQDASTVQLVDAVISGSGIVVSPQATVETSAATTISDTESTAVLDGGTLRVTGTLTTTGSITGDGTIEGAGTLINNGAISRTVNIDDSDGLSVLDHHYELSLDGNAGAVDWGGATPWSIVDGPTLASVGRSSGDLPTATRDGHAFAGWFLTTDAAGDQFTDATELPGSSSDGTPVPITLYAGWTSDAPGCTPAAFAAALTGASDGGTVNLCGDLTIAADDNLPLAVAAGASITLDLNGHTLEVTAPDDHAGIAVLDGSGLTITDSSSAGTGVLVANGGESAAGIGGNPHLDPGTITIDAGTVTATGHASCARDTFDPCAGAGIGGGLNGKNGTITINGGTVTAIGNGSSAGIGGGGASSGQNGGSITITGGTVTATGGNDTLGAGAGIGSGANRTAGPITITGGTVTATGGDAPTDASGMIASGGAGIGAGSITEVPTGDITITAAQVVATGGTGTQGGAGIGGGGCAVGPLVSIAGAGTTVTATGTAGGAGIGGGNCDVDSGGGDRAAGGTVTIGAGAQVAVSSDGGNAVGNGAGSTEFGSLSNAGTLTVDSPLAIPAGVTLSNVGTLTANAPISNSGTIDGAGILNGTDTIDNAGALWHTLTIGDQLTITDHHYALSFDEGQGGDGLTGAAALRLAAATATLIVDGPTLASVGRMAADLPVPTRAGYTFTGWFTDAATSDPITDDAVFSGSSADGTPVTVQLYAGWDALPTPTTPTTPTTEPTTTAPTTTEPTTAAPTTAAPTAQPEPPADTASPTAAPTSTASSSSEPPASTPVPPAADPGGLAQTGASGTMLPVVIAGLLLLLGGALVLLTLGRRRGSRTGR